MYAQKIAQPRHPPPPNLHATGFGQSDQVAGTSRGWATGAIRLGHHADP